MKIAIITGPREISREDEKLVRAVVREIIAQGYEIYVGDAAGVDTIARLVGREKAHLFFPNETLRRSPAGLAERSTRMVKEALRACPYPAHSFKNGDEIICVGFPNKPCPSGIVPAKSWRSGTAEGSGTWSTLALCVGHGIETWIVPLPEHAMSGAFIYSWPAMHWQQFGKEFSGWHFTPAPSLFSNQFPELGHDALCDGYTELARANSADGN